MNIIYSSRIGNSNKHANLTKLRSSLIHQALFVCIYIYISGKGASHWIPKKRRTRLARRDQNSARILRGLPAKFIHDLQEDYPLVNIQKTMENHHFEWVNQLYL